MNKKLQLRCCIIIIQILPYMPLLAQSEYPDTAGQSIYYIGINPVAPFTGIRTRFTSHYLPAISNLETGVALSVGKLWSGHYNVETRVSFGSPGKGSNLFIVQSGFNYLFKDIGANLYPYAGMFLKLYSLHDLQSEKDDISVIGYFCLGNRFLRKQFFLDLRIAEHIYAFSWSNNPDTKASGGFHPSVFGWQSPYLPYLSLGVGILFKH